MRTNFNKEKLEEFTQEIVSLYKQGKIKSPIHLSGGSESKLIKIFKKYYKKNYWIFSTHRSHYHWLLSGRDQEELKNQILDGHSMHIFGNKFFTSAIVAGNASIAVGTALALKLKKSSELVFCVIGDMAYECGITQEAIKFSQRNNLPIIFFVEDNMLSVKTPTQKSWGSNKIRKGTIKRYKYNRHYNHAGPFKNGDKKFVLF